MADHPLPDAILDALRKWNTPTIANAIEVFNVRGREVGFLPHQIRCLLPEIGPVVGYAVTSKTIAAPPTGPAPDLTADYLRYVASVPGPKIAVGQDLDDPPGLGAQFGEVNSTIHKKLGCVGHVTSGCPRDLDEVAAMGFALFGLNPCVSHAYVRLAEFGTPVMIGGVEIRPGDLLHADKHGVCIIPLEIAERLPEACAEVERLERPLLEACRRETFSLDEYLEARVAMKAKIRE
ncbi:MAG: RraA family protein [Isosphaeraceae bacterium]|nr:RraA family protein [Isosphaeraceae bacterium]